MLSRPRHAGINGSFRQSASLAFRTRIAQVSPRYCPFPECTLDTRIAVFRDHTKRSPLRHFQVSRPIPDRRSGKNKRAFVSQGLGFWRFAAIRTSRRAKWGWILNGGVSPFVLKCPGLSRFVLVCPNLSPFWAPKRQKRTNGDKPGHFGADWEMPHLGSTPI